MDFNLKSDLQETCLTLIVDSTVSAVWPACILRPAVNPQAGLLAVCSYEALLPGGMTNGDVAVKVLRRCKMLHTPLLRIKHVLMRHNQRTSLKAWLAHRQQ